MTAPSSAKHGHMIAGLIAKRREIAAAVEELQGQVKYTVSQLDRIEATIRIFQPDIDLLEFGGRPVPPAHQAFKGELSRILLASLRSANGPISTHKLTEVVIRERGLPMGDLKLRRVMQQRIGSTLNNWRRVKKVLKSSPGPGQMLLWELVKRNTTA